MNKEKDAIPVNHFLKEAAKAIFDISLAVENLQLKSKIFEPVLNEEQVKLMCTVGEVLAPKKQHVPRFKIGDYVMYSNDSSGFSFVISETKITDGGVFYKGSEDCTEWLPQNTIARITLDVSGLK